MKLTDQLETEYGTIAETQKEAIKGDLENTALAEIYKTFTESEEMKDRTYISSNYGVYRNLIALNLGEFYSKDITQFCVMMCANDQEIKHFKDFGLFCSALINAHYENTKQTGEYEIILPITNKKPSYIGYANNGATIHITGESGDYLGTEMKSGKIIVYGSCENHTGYMLEGGEIIVEKNVGIETGSFMKAGHITIKGNAAYNLGRHMLGGRIDIYGTIEDTYISTNGGKIYHKEKRIDGKMKHAETDSEIVKQSLLTKIKNFLRGRK